MPKNEIFVEDHNQTIIVIDGKKYKMKVESYKIIDHHKHPDKVVFEPFDEIDHTKRVDFIVNKIRNSISIDDVLRDVLNTITSKELRHIEKLLKKGKKVKKTSGCLGLTIGEDSSGTFLQLS